MQAIDSLQERKDSLLEVRSGMKEKDLKFLSHGEEETESAEPLYLTGQQLIDRAACL
jgi:hypothetical protein